MDIEGFQIGIFWMAKKRALSGSVFLLRSVKRLEVRNGKIHILMRTKSLRRFERGISAVPAHQLSHHPFIPTYSLHLAIMIVAGFSTIHIPPIRSTLSMPSVFSASTTPPCEFTARLLVFSTASVLLPTSNNPAIRYIL